MKKQIVFNCSDCGKTVTKYLNDTDPHFDREQPFLTNLLRREHELVCTCIKRTGYVTIKLNYYQYSQLNYLVNKMDKSVEVVDEIADMVKDVLETNRRTT